MTETMSAASHEKTKKLFSEQEKRDYYRAWEKSGLSKSDFCKEHKLPINSLYYWHELFKKEALTTIKQFSPVVAKINPSDHPQTVMQLEMRLPNHVQLFIPLRESHLVSFIQELCNAVTVIR